MDRERRFPARVAKIFFKLLGNCFWREGLEAAFGPERRGAKGGCSLQPRCSMFKFTEVEKRKMAQQSVKYSFW